jgi:hypothetical protein
MARSPIIAALILGAALPCAAGQADTAIGSMRLPLPAADLAAAINLSRVDPSTLPIDIVRIAYAFPDNANLHNPAVREALARALSQRGSGDLVPLPLTPRLWTEHVLREAVPEDRLAAAIFSQRRSALLYHGLFGMDRDTLRWIERNPAALRALAAHPGAAAVFAGAIRIRDNAIATPGDNAGGVWAALVGVDPAQPVAFIERLLSRNGGALAGFYDTVARLDPARQAFAIGRNGDPARVDLARRVFASTVNAAGWTIEDRPFLRPDVDLLMLLRAVALDGRGVPDPPASRALWAAVFGSRDASEAPVDAAWLARHLLDSTGSASRRRLDAFRFAQRALGGTFANGADLVFVLREFARFPALIGVLESLGLRDASVYAAAARAAAAMEDDEASMTLFQSLLAIVDRARRSRTLDADQARALATALVDTGAQRSRRGTLVDWIGTTLLPAFRRATGDDGSRGAERLVLEAIGGRAVSPAVVVRWEGADYTADVASAELRRLLRIRGRQGEAALEKALATASAGDVRPLVSSLAAVVYAAALGEADSAAVNAGPVWRRHQFRGTLAAQGGTSSPWRLATEVFSPAGWHLAGSLLRLDMALPHLSLRRLDTTEMPGVSLLSTSDRKTIATSVALVDPQRLTNAERDAIAASLERGRARIAALAASKEGLDGVVDAAALSGWRRNAMEWLIANDPSRVATSLTLLEQFRVGGAGTVDGWGASALPLDGCMCLRQPASVPWEEYTGRASTGRLGTQLSDVMLRTADVLSRRKLPALLARDVAAYATQDALDRGRAAYLDDWLPVAFAARDLPDERFDDYVAALTVSGPLIPVARSSIR